MYVKCLFKNYNNDTLTPEKNPATPNMKARPPRTPTILDTTTFFETMLTILCETI